MGWPQWKSDKMAGMMAELQALRTELTEITNKFEEVHRLGTRMELQIKAWGGDAAAAKANAESAEQVALRYSERLGQRVGVCESTLGRINGTILQHERIFRA